MHFKERGACAPRDRNQSRSFGDELEQAVVALAEEKARGARLEAAAGEARRRLASAEAEAAARGAREGSSTEELRVALEELQATTEELGASNAALARANAGLEAKVAARTAKLAAANAVLREGETRWRGLFERMHEGFAHCEVVRGPDGRAMDFRCLEVNAAWERLTGLPAEAVQGRLAGEATPGVEPFWLQTCARVAETGEPAHFERRLAALGRWFEVIAYRTEPGRFAALFLDVTERKAAEARRDALVELGDRLRDLRDPGAIARTAAEVIGRALGADRAGYGAVDADEATIRIERDWTGGPQVASVAGEHRLPDYWSGFADALRRGEVVAVGDVAADPRTAAFAGNFAAVGVRAFMHAPVVERGRVAALLFVHDAAPREWSAEEVSFVRGAAERAWAVAERARAEARRALLANELNHRVKNTLAVVQSLAAQTARGAPDLPSFGAAFQARLIALARAHDLLTREDWTGAPLDAVFRTALEPLGIDGARLEMSGCGSRALQPPGAALALAMAVHELATNALKHGALSVPQGRVSVACADADAAPVMEWVERGGPPVAGPPARRGFGMRLLNGRLAAQAGMGADLRFEPEGVRCILRLPPPPRAPSLANEP
jgi:two-component sensor histidine kinase/PAS domain-containing protein